MTELAGRGLIRRQLPTEVNPHELPQVGNHTALPPSPGRTDSTSAGENESVASVPGLPVDGLYP